MASNFFSGVGDLFGNASLGDIGGFVAGIATAGVAIKSLTDKGPEAPSFDLSPTAVPEKVVQQVGLEAEERRKRTRTRSVASKNISFLGDADIGALQLSG